MDTIFIVEDEVTARDLLSELLQKDRRQIAKIGGGKEALQRMTKRPRHLNPA